MKDIIVAIDGYAATGKSTQAKKLASYLNYKYIDSGAMYRAVTLFAIRNNVFPDQNRKINLMLSDIEIKFDIVNGENTTFLNGENVEKLIRSYEVSNKVSLFSEIKQIRDFLINKQRLFGIKKKIIMDGRDIGNVVFPNAECKFFFKSDVKISADRRYREIIESGSFSSYEDVLLEVSERDSNDSKRIYSPLKKANDSIEIDVSNKSVNQIFDDLKTIIDMKMGE